MRANYKRYETKTMKTEALWYEIGRQRAEGSRSTWALAIWTACKRRWSV